MPFIPVENTIMVELRYLIAAQRVENTLYFRNESGPWAQAEAATFAQLIGSWWDTNIKPLLTNEISLTEVYVTDLSSATSWTVTVPLLPPVAGTINEEAMPLNVALCISFRTGNRGRSGRGRNYVVGLVGSQITSSTLNTTPLNAFVAAYNDLKSDVAAAGVTWVVVSRRSNNAPRVEGITQAIDAAVATDPYVDSQRRRLPGRGT